MNIPTAFKVDLAIIVPTLNEAGNIAALYNELTQVLDNIRWQLIFVDDDSSDNTRANIRSLANTDRRVHLVHRIGRRGLSSACLEGMAASDSRYILVMDADLQHDTRIIPQMMESLQHKAYDLAVGSRFKTGATIAGLSKFREESSRWVNRTITLLTKNKISDPLSGFFMLPREVYDSTKYEVSGLGFKILLDIIMSSKRQLKIQEIPFEFRERHAESSKLDISIVAEFAGLIIEKLSIGKFPMRFFMFLCVGSIGAILHFLVMGILYRYFTVDFIYAQAGATYVAIIFNFYLNNAFTYRDQRLKGTAVIRGLLIFMLVCSVGAANNLIVAETLHNYGIHWFLASFTGAIYGSVWNYFMSNILVWFKKPHSASAPNESISE
jgi:dolichol-phosphate mannosyltransferase